MFGKRLIFGKTWGWRIFRLRGFDVILDYTFAIAVVFALLSARGLITEKRASFGLALADFVSLVIFFLLSTLAHELSHAFVGMAFGAEVQTVRIHAFGGWTRFSRPARTDKGQFLTSIAGPGANFLIALVLGGVAFVADDGRGLASPLVYVLVWGFGLNVALGLLNSLPALPFDGGQGLRSALLWATHRETLAAKVLAVTGRGTSIVLAIAVIPVTLLEGFGNGLLIAVLAFVVYRLSRQQRALAAGKVRGNAVKGTIIEATARDVTPTAPALFDSALTVTQKPYTTQPTQTAVRVTPQTEADLLFAQGQTAHSEGRYSDAVRAFSEALTLAPRTGRYALYRAYANTALKNYAAALDDVESVVQAEPKNATALANLANLATLRQDYAKAADAYTRLTALQPANAQTFYDLACTHARLVIRNTPPGTVPALVAALTTATRLNPALRDQARSNSLFTALKTDPAIAAALA